MCSAVRSWETGGVVLPLLEQVYMRRRGAGNGRSLNAPGRTLGGPGMQPALEPSAQTSPAMLEWGVYLGWFPRARRQPRSGVRALESKCGHWLRS